MCRSPPLTHQQMSGSSRPTALQVAVVSACRHALCSSRSPSRMTHTSSRSSTMWYITQMWPLPMSQTLETLFLELYSKDMPRLWIFSKHNILYMSLKHFQTQTSSRWAQTLMRMSSAYLLDMYQQAQVLMLQLNSMQRVVAWPLTCSSHIRSTTQLSIHQLNSSCRLSHLSLPI